VMFADNDVHRRDRRDECTIQQPSNCLGELGVLGVERTGLLNQRVRAAVTSANRD
jgi:hypothetical protein